MLSVPFCGKSINAPFILLDKNLTICSPCSFSYNLLSPSILLCQRIVREHESFAWNTSVWNSTFIPVLKCFSSGLEESVVSLSINPSFHQISSFMTKGKFTYDNDVCVEGDVKMSSNSTFVFDGFSDYSDSTIDAEYCSEGMCAHHCVRPSNLLIEKSKLYIFGGAANAKEARMEAEGLEQKAVRPESISCTPVTAGKNDDQVYEIDADSDEVEHWRGHQRSMQHCVDVRLGVGIIFVIVIVIIIILFCSLRRVAVAEAARCAAEATVEAARRRAEAAQVEADVQRAVAEDARIKVEKILAARVEADVQRVEADVQRAEAEDARIKVEKERYADIFDDCDSDGDDPIELLVPFKWLQSKCTNCGRGVGSRGSTNCD